MVTKFEDLMNDMVNIGIGVAATAAEKSREMLDGFSAKGAEARADAAQSDFGRAMADVFERAGGTFSDVTERLSATGAPVAERILDELILARLRGLSATERVEFLAHVRDLADSVDDRTVTVEVESIEQDDAEDETTAGAAEEQDA